MQTDNCNSSLFQIRVYLGSGTVQEYCQAHIPQVNEESEGGGRGEEKRRRK